MKNASNARVVGEKTQFVKAGRCFFLAFLFILYFIYPAQNASANSSKCLECHDDLGYSESWLHASEGCTGCHSLKKGVEHPDNVEPVNCGKCHEDVEESFKESIHARTSPPLTCQDCHGYHPVYPSNDSESPVFKSNIAKTCARCHEDEEIVKKKGIPIKKPLKAYLRSVHGRAVMEKGEIYAATCSDCHGSHKILPGSNPASPINRLNVPKMCGKCHNGIYKTYMESIHGQAFIKGAQDAPVCTTCHGEHEILPPEEPGSLVYTTKIAKTTCTQCHASERIVKKYGIPADRFITYEDSYHGLADMYGDTRVANCASCHGYHGVFPSWDPRSTVNKKNLPKTCGKCHPGATEKFAEGKVHAGISPTPKTLADKVKYFVRLFYIIIIPVTIIGMFLHNFLDFIKRIKLAIEERKRVKTYPRLTKPERIQHLLMFLSFIVLVITGFALRFRWEIPMLPGEVNSILRGTVHRVAAVVFIFSCIWHIFYIVFTPEGRKFFWDMIPRPRDLVEAVQTLLYYVGLADKPKYGRFTYVEKAEYLALIWGAIVMIVTGLILWFEEEAMRYIPKWGVDVADMIHYYEAILATLAIIVWHFYHVHIKGGVKHMNLSWITGTLTEEEMEDEHPELLEKEETQGEWR